MAYFIFSQSSCIVDRGNRCVGVTVHNSEYYSSDQEYSVPGVNSVLFKNKISIDARNYHFAVL